jgi:hypothetical protein
MRERIEAQGGVMELRWQATGGIVLTAWMPATVKGVEDGQ